VFILDTSEGANHKIKRGDARCWNSTHCELWESTRAGNDHQIPGARISAGGWMPSRGEKGRTSPTQTEIEWTSGTKNERGFGKQPNSGSSSWRSGELVDGYKDNSGATLFGQAVHR